MTLLPARFRSGLRRGRALPIHHEPPPLPAERAVLASHIPPSERERRVEMVQRLQVGVFGLLAMVLLVALAQIIMQHARSVDAANPAPIRTAAPAGTTDPLADIGVAPAQDAGSANSRHAAAHAAGR